MCQAMRSLEKLEQNDLSVEQIIPGGLLKVHCNFGCALPRMAMPDFVLDMERRLGVNKAKAEIVVVPYKGDVLYVANSSSALGCSALGDFADAIDEKNQREVRNQFMYSVPFRVRAINTNGPVTLASVLLAQGKTPVVWELYPLFGQNAFSGGCSEAQNGVVRFPVPRGERQADEWLRLGSNTEFTVFLLIGNPSADPSLPLAVRLPVCAQCFTGPLRKGKKNKNTAGFDRVPNDLKFEKCDCGLVQYCSAACRQLHSEVHTEICTEACIRQRLDQKDWRDELATLLRAAPPLSGPAERQHRLLDRLLLQPQGAAVSSRLPPGYPPPLLPSDPSLCSREGESSQRSSWHVPPPDRFGGCLDPGGACVGAWVLR
mmetsp:Transcript_52812/g.103260  ORF Transcript_52812/g.103260 Transcript_52812/m.103260 type:complete len:373 (-) Transcript_52812:643-1761(-)